MTCSVAASWGIGERSVRGHDHGKAETSAERRADPPGELVAPPHTPAGANLPGHASLPRKRLSRGKCTPRRTPRPKTFAAAQQRAYCRASSSARRSAAAGSGRALCRDLVVPPCAHRPRRRTAAAGAGVRVRRAAPAPAAAEPPGRPAPPPRPRRRRRRRGHGGAGAGSGATVAGTGTSAGGSPGGGTSGGGMPTGRRRSAAACPSQPAWTRHRSAPDLNKTQPRRARTRRRASGRCGLRGFDRPGTVGTNIPPTSRARVRRVRSARFAPSGPAPAPRAFTRQPCLARTRARLRVLVRKPCNTGLGNS